MKIPISSHHHIDLDAPTIGCDEVISDGRLLWRFFCRHCCRFHYHGPAQGHRISHCQVPGGPYENTGYNRGCGLGFRTTLGIDASKHIGGDA